MAQGRGRAKAEANGRLEETGWGQEHRAQQTPGSGKEVRLLCDTGRQGGRVQVQACVG